MKKTFAILLAVMLFTNVSFAASIGAGYKNSLFEYNGYCYGVGANDFGQLANKSYIIKGTPVKIDGISGVKDIAVGYEYFVFVDGKGEVYTVGKNNQSQLGQGDFNIKPELTKVEGLKDIVDVSAGYAHTLALDKYGNVYGFGRNDRGQLGAGDYLTKEKPVKIYSGDVKKVECNVNYSYILLNDGTAISFGANEKGQLARGNYLGRNLPVKVEAINNVVDLSCGIDSVLFVKNDGTVWGVGDNSRGQLGVGNYTNAFPLPQKVLIENAKAASAGVDYSLFLTNAGEVYSTGANNVGQLGINDFNGTSKPVKVDIANVVEISAGHIHAIVKLVNGRINGFGSNRFGALGVGDYNNSAKPVEVKFDYLDPSLAEKNSPFIDVPSDSEDFPAVKFMFERGISKGTGQGYFSPDLNLSRAQLLVMVLRASDIGEMKGDNFADAGDTYYTGYLAAAKQKGISKGVGDNMFVPDKKITKEEMYTLLYNSLRALDKIDNTVSDVELASYTGGDKVATWAQEATKYMLAKGYLKLENNEIKAKEDAARVDLARLLYEILR